MLRCPARSAVLATFAVLASLTGIAGADEKVLSPREARALEGKEVTVEATVQAAGKYKRGTAEHHFWLVNAKLPKTFTQDTVYVAIPVTEAKKFGQEDLDKLQFELFQKYHEKTIRVRGTVRLEKDEDGKESRVRIDVTDPKQITIAK